MEWRERENRERERERREREREGEEQREKGARTQSWYKGLTIKYVVLPFATDPKMLKSTVGF